MHVNLQSGVDFLHDKSIVSGNTKKILVHDKSIMSGNTNKILVVLSKRHL